MGGATWQDEVTSAANALSLLLGEPGEPLVARHTRILAFQED